MDIYVLLIQRYAHGCHPILRV